MDVGTVILLAIGAVPGFLGGRWWAEFRRGTHDARQAFKGRRRYRGK